MTHAPANAVRDPGLAFFMDARPAHADFLADAVAGLSASPKRLSPKYFYDERGSALFDRICQTPEYYPTRTELWLLGTHGAEIAAAAGNDCLVIEYGAGSSLKIRRLLELLEAPAGYVAVDISRDYLLDQMTALAADMPHVPVGAICADFTRSFALPPEAEGLGTRRLGFLPGSTIGNFAPDEAGRLLARAARQLGPGGRFLIGVDLKKEKSLLDAAYDDAEGVTAAFNLNLLRRLRRELGADLDEDGFAHVAFYNAGSGRVEMHLEARGPQTIRLAGREFALRDGERIHTENSYKYSPDDFAQMARSAGFERQCLWTDPDGLFSLHMLEVQG